MCNVFVIDVRNLFIETFSDLLDTQNTVTVLFIMTKYLGNSKLN